MDGWSKVAAGVVLGVAGTVYATNRHFRENLPPAARNLPDNVRGRFKSAVSAAREASASRRQEILQELRGHAQSEPPRNHLPPGDFQIGGAEGAAKLEEEGPPAETGGGVSA